ncbi:glycosyltransferase family 2 protein [soil metagenome]
MITLTGIIIAKNEEGMIADAIDSLSFCEEVIVIDNGSKDRTADIAKLLKAIVIINNSSSFAELRDNGRERAKGKWLFYIDADERVTPELQKEIENVVQHKTAKDVYRVERKNFYYGKFAWPVTEKLERLFKKTSLKGWRGVLHESPTYEGERADLPGYLLHYTHRDLQSMIEKTNAWSEAEAKLRFDANHPRMVPWRFFSVMVRTFWRYYVKDKGYKAGISGLVESMYQVFSMFITYAKLWELQQLHEKTK